MPNVLVVDDDANNRLLLATLLKHAGHTALEAADATAALKIAAESQPALIIVDLSLPDMPGTTLIKRLRSDPLTANTKIALYTATRLDAATQELTELYNVRAIIPKPGDPKKILKILARLLD